MGHKRIVKICNNVGAAAAVCILVLHMLVNICQYIFILKYSY